MDKAALWADLDDLSPRRDDLNGLPPTPGLLEIRRLLLISSKNLSKESNLAKLQLSINPDR